MKFLRNVCTPPLISKKEEWQLKEWEEKPLLIYDGDCGFCVKWVEYWKKLTGGTVVYAPFQEVGKYFPQIPQEQFQESVQLILPDGKRFSGAHAVFHTLEHAPGKGWLLWMYEHVPGFAPISEVVYRFIAAHRASL